MIFTIMPRMRAVATVVMVTAPKLSESPPIPAINMVDAVKRLRLSPKSTGCSILSPETAMKPYKDMHTPPITHEGMELKKAITGEMKEITIARHAVQIMVMTDALPVIATQAMDSP